MEFDIASFPNVCPHVQAAAERGEKLGELEDAAGAMRNQAAGFAETTRQLAMKK